MTEVKICGLVRPEDVEAANRLRPDYVGFVLFFPKSKRNLSLAEAATLKSGLEPGIGAVAVTVSPTADQAKQIEEAGFDYIQIHGSLDKEVYEILSIPILRACNIKDSRSLILQKKDDHKIAGYVFDSKDPGSGRTFDWNILKGLDLRGRKLILAGGINEHNVEEAMRIVKPDVIDLSSSVELADVDGRSGGKDPELMSIMIRKVHDEE